MPTYTFPSSTQSSTLSIVGSSSEASSSGIISSSSEMMSSSAITSSDNPETSSVISSLPDYTTTITSGSSTVTAVVSEYTTTDSAGSMYTATSTPPVNMEPAYGSSTIGGRLSTSINTMPNLSGSSISLPATTSTRAIGGDVLEALNSASASPSTALQSGNPVETSTGLQFATSASVIGYEAGSASVSIKGSVKLLFSSLMILTIVF
ncbi:hypothetical protein KAFR_0G00610 [Kazachstania africana CBS 2517]|uniref:Uncharacterized protein n=1 Tax=Kazachstania africana (strain ATCC 22294 / BCRC 22015 / CBS 2517 / CECT 1963 / NBRC 1671 / NRRL Y-8276) TaxID=1071382 RepID=H2AXJ4_KAZAF|nr:hypothetical protein KAFR_0G00610 [Kazachstania africana CBS 2517]CCF59094.1 hypothetical protein KAFR_0G00610 [Kazachstania africana CBS 2517]